MYSFMQTHSGMLLQTTSTCTRMPFYICIGVVPAYVQFYADTQWHVTADNVNLHTNAVLYLYRCCASICAVLCRHTVTCFCRQRQPAHECRSIFVSVLCQHMYSFMQTHSGMLLQTTSTCTRMPFYICIGVVPADVQFYADTQWHVTADNVNLHTNAVLYLYQCCAS